MVSEKCTAGCGEVSERLKLTQVYCKQLDFLIPLSETEYNVYCQDQYSGRCWDGKGPRYSFPLQRCSPFNEKARMDP